MTIIDSLGELKKANIDGMKNLRSMTGVPPTEQKVFDSITPQEFQHLSNKFGVDRVVQFIKEMETKRMMGD